MKHRPSYPSPNTHRPSPVTYIHKLTLFSYLPSIPSLRRRGIWGGLNLILILFTFAAILLFPLPSNKRGLRGVFLRITLLLLLTFITFASPIGWHGQTCLSVSTAFAQSWDELAASATGGGVSNNAGGSGWPSLALDSSGRPHIAWYDNSGGDVEIYYAYWDGDSWETYGAANTGGGVSNNAGGSASPSLALDTNGNPHIAWLDSSGGGGDYETYYAYWDGANWVTQGGANTGGGVSNNAGDSYRPSLALDTNGRPHIAWEDNGWEIYYRYWNPGVTPLEKPQAKHVVIIDIDGLRPDIFKEELEAGHLPTFAEILGTTNYCNPQDDPNSHCIVVKDARTGFPSLTLPGHASIFTGCYINKHGIYANNWLDRKSSQGKEGEGYHYLQTVIVATDFDLANSHLQADTIYEAGYELSEGFTAIVGFNFYIGSTYSFTFDKEACKETYSEKQCKKMEKNLKKEWAKEWNKRYKDRLKWIQPDSSAKFCFAKPETNDYDRLMVLNVLDELRGRMYSRRKWDAAKFPNIVTLYFAAVDHEGHKKGVCSQAENLVKIDEQLDLLINGNPYIEKASCGYKLFKTFPGLKNIPSESGIGTLLDDTVFVMCADHGHSDVCELQAGNSLCEEDSECKDTSICYEELKDAIEGLDPNYIVTRIAPTEDEKRLKAERGEEPNIVLANNDGMAQIYVQNKDTKKWADSPDLCNDIVPFARILARTQDTLGDYILKRKGVSMILVKDKDAGKYKVFNGGNGCISPMEELTEYFTDDEAFRINMLYNGVYSGDIVILANYEDNTPGYYLSDSDWAIVYGWDNCASPMKSDHGNINSDNLKIPFIIAGKNVKSASVPKAEQVDIAPTVADILGFGMPQADGTSIFQK